MTTDLTLTVLGSDGSWPGPGGACSGYLVRSTTTSIWVDAGTGTFAALQQHVALDRLGGVVLTHQHADHCSDITGLRAYALYGPGLPCRVPVYAAAGVAETAMPGSDPTTAFDWRLIDDQTEVTVGDISLSFRRTDHGPPTFAVMARSGGRTLAYSADTGPAWSFSSFGTAIDLALCEAAYPPGHVGPGHLNPTQAGADARTSSVGRLVLTHVRPGDDRPAIEQVASVAFGGPVEVVSAGDVFRV